MGNPVGEKTPGQFLQVRPESLRESRSPIFCTRPMDPDVDDLMCYEETQIRRKIYHPAPQQAAGSKNRLLDFESPASVEETPLVMNQLREGVWIPAGVCFVNDRPDPTDDEVEMAIRSQPQVRVVCVRDCRRVPRPQQMCAR